MGDEDEADDKQTVVTTDIKEKRSELKMKSSIVGDEEISSSNEPKTQVEKIKTFPSIAKRKFSL